MSPNQLKNLQVGQALLISSKVDPRFGLIDIFKANDYSEIYKMPLIRFSNPIAVNHSPAITETKNLSVIDII